MSFKLIKYRQKELDELHAEIFKKQAANERIKPTVATPIDFSDKAIIEKARNAGNGRKFELLWRGDWKGAGHPSPSEADLALCSMLAFWCGNNVSCIDRLFRRSRLYRNKWDEKHYGNGSTYGEIVIQKAVSTTYEVYEPRKTDSPQLATLSSSSSLYIHDDDDDKIGLESGLLYTFEEENPEYILRPWILEGVVNGMHADPGSLKSFIALLFATVVSGGLTIFDQNVKQMPTLYLDAELKGKLQRYRQKIIRRGLGIPVDLQDSLHYINVGTFGLSNTNTLAFIKNYIIQNGIRFIIVDSFAFAFAADQKDPREVIGALGYFTRMGLTVLILDHQRKPEPNENTRGRYAFGSVFKIAQARNITQLIKDQQSSTEGLAVLSVHHLKNNFKPVDESFGLDCCFEGDCFRVEKVELSENHAHILSSYDRDMIALREISEGTAEQINAALPKEHRHELGTTKNNLTKATKKKQIHVAKTMGKTYVYKYGPPSSPSLPIGDDDDDELLCVEEVAEIFDAKVILPGDFRF